MPDWDGSEGVFKRRLVFCELLDGLDFDELIAVCPRCDSFSALCCLHRNTTRRACHHFRLVFTDGACLGNGTAGATAGIGGAYGLGEQQQWAVPVDDEVDAYPVRTSQRAELVAAIEGLRRLARAKQQNDLFHEGRSHAAPRGEPRARGCWVVTTDSEYVVKGMSEWLPKWKQHGLKTAQGKRPANLDLFQRLEEEMLAHEREHGIDVGFWHVPRMHNATADALAKRAARMASPVWP